MRLPVVLFLSFLTILFAVGCRKPLTPNIDRNLAPETWLVAAPQDTLTEYRDGVPQRPIPPKIAARFHLYWAGSDPDGAIAGFYFAVTETLPVAPPGFRDIPSLPGPKARDYRFTTKTDSVFVFRVSEFSRDRQHAFFIYAVDAQGKADPTPARITFSAFDQFPPVPVIEQATGSGPIYRVVNGQVRVENVVVSIHDTLAADNSNFSVPPADTVPNGARLDFRWRGEITLAGSYVTGYQYKLDEPLFVSVDSSVHSVSYNTGLANDAVTPGSKIFNLRVRDEAEGVRLTNRRFYMNYAPDTWFSGPDTLQYPKRDGTTGLEDPFNRFSERFVTMPGANGWRNMGPQPGSLLSCDSLGLLPAMRPQRKSFFEIYQNRLYVHAENDTVRLNSYVLLHSGGSDLDSPYDVRVADHDPDLGADTTACAPTNPVVAHRTGPNGSPIGFHHQFVSVLDQEGHPFISPGAPSNLFPVYDPSSAFRVQTIGGYRIVPQSGKVYAVMRSEDGNRLLDRRLSNSNVRQIADRVDAGGGTEDERALRSRILTFYVNKAPKLLVSRADFVPPQPWPYTFPPGSRQLLLKLYADDEDPLDPGNRPGPGGPSGTKVLRWLVQVKGRDSLGNAILYPPNPVPGFSPSIDIQLPSEMVSTSDTIKVQLCDCAFCEIRPGDGRCVYYDIPINVPPPPAPTGTTEATIGSLPRPGNSNEAVKRSASR